MPDGQDFQQTLNDAATQLLKARQEWESDKTHEGKSMSFALENALVQKWSGGKFSRGDVDTYLSKVVMPNSTGVLPQIRQTLSGASLGLGPLLERALKPEQAAQSRLQQAALETAKPGPAFVEQAGGALGTGMFLPGGPAGRGVMPTIGRILTGGAYGTGMAAANVAGQAPTGQATQALQQNALPIAASGAIGAAIPGVIEGVHQVAPRLGLGDPFQRMSNYMTRDYLPQIGGEGTAESGAQQLLANRQAWAPPPRVGTPGGPMTTADPMAAEAMGAPGTQAWRQAITNSPALRGIAANSPQIEGRTLKPWEPGYIADLAGGIKQALARWSDPIYSRLRADNPRIGAAAPTGFTAAEAKAPSGYQQSVSAAKKAYQDAIQGGWVPSGDPAEIIPGTGNGSGLVGVRQMYKEVFGKEPPVKTNDFDNWFRLKKTLDRKVTQLQKGTASLTTDYDWTHVAKVRDAIDQELMNAVPEYADTQHEYAARAMLARKVAGKAGSVAMPKAEEASMASPSGIGGWAYRLGLPIIKHTVGAARENTMAELARFLSSRGSETEMLLQRILAKQPGLQGTIPVGASAAAGSTIAEEQR